MDTLTYLLTHRQIFSWDSGISSHWLLIFHLPPNTSANLSSLLYKLRPHLLHCAIERPSFIVVSSRALLLCFKSCSRGCMLNLLSRHQGHTLCFKSRRQFARSVYLCTVEVGLSSLLLCHQGGWGNPETFFVTGYSALFPPEASIAFFIVISWSLPR